MAENTKSSEPDDDNRYLVADRNEIVRIFRGVAKRKGHLLRAILREGNELPSMVLGIDPDADALYVDCTASASDNRRIEESSRIHYVTMIDGVKIEWISSRADKTQFEGRDAFQLSIPEQVQRVQRRDCYRLDTPLNNPIICTVRLADGQTLDVTLVDVSVGGIGVALPESAEENLERGAVFPGCRIDFPGIGVVDVTLRVQMTWEIIMKNGNKSRRAGLEFVDLRLGTESLIQRYMVKLERERITNA
jgi:c-di-GMP-binding flagellar brake protein YcgR